MSSAICTVLFSRRSGMAGWVLVQGPAAGVHGEYLKSGAHMQDIVIVGVGGLGREIAEWIEDINEVAPTFRVLGFLDDDASKHGSNRHDLPVLGGLDWLTERSRTVATVVGVGNPAPKRRVVER